jgi:hypothetical protein
MAARSPERADLIDKLRSHHAELVEVVRRRAESELTSPPAAGEWTALQQLEHHLLVEDVWTKAASRAAFEDEPDLAELWATYRRVEEQNPFPPPSETRTLEELLQALEARHSETLALVESIPEQAFERRGRNTGFGNLTVLQMLRAIYRHTRMHIDQIEGREPSFQPRRVS